MIWNIKDAGVPVGNTEMRYVSFGNGKKTLILLPGLSDGLATVKGKGLFLAEPYRMFFRDYTVYMFSRKEEMPDGYSIRDMALDQAAAMRQLGIEKAAVVGVSQGGMIAQYLAAEAPELVAKLILAVTAAKISDMTAQCVEKWIGLAEEKNQGELMIDTAEKSYTEKRLRSYRKAYPLFRKMPKLKDSRRFLVNARAILAFDGEDVLAKIRCPVLIIGGQEDRIVGAAASEFLHEKIAGSRLYIYPGSGHGAYEEEKDFNERIFRFLQET